MVGDAQAAFSIKGFKVMNLDNHVCNVKRFVTVPAAGKQINGQNTRGHTSKNCHCACFIFKRKCALRQAFGVAEIDEYVCEMQTLSW